MKLWAYVGKIKSSVTNGSDIWVYGVIHGDNRDFVLDKLRENYPAAHHFNLDEVSVGPGVVFELIRDCNC